MEVMYVTDMLIHNQNKLSHIKEVEMNINNRSIRLLEQ